jgi:hypothetical protein
MSLKPTDLNCLIERNTNLDDTQKIELFNALVRYLSFMSAKPGKCNLLKYKFQVETNRPIMGYSRPIPFAIRPAVREQIAQMIDDDILEISNSSFLNPLTIVDREDKKPRICVHARRG